MSALDNANHFDELANALEAVNAPSELRLALRLYLESLACSARDDDEHALALIRTALDPKSSQPEPELCVARLLETVRSLSHSADQLLPALTRIHAALAGSRTTIHMTFDELQLARSATFALGVWSFEQVDPKSYVDETLARFAEAVSDRLGAASGLPFLRGIAAATAAAGTRVLRLELSDVESRLTGQALDACSAEFEGNWNEFRLAFTCQVQGDLTPMMRKLAASIASAPLSMEVATSRPPR